MKNNIAYFFATFCLSASFAQAQSDIEGVFWANLEAHSPSSERGIGVDPVSFKGIFTSVSFAGVQPPGISSEVYGEWSVDVQSSIGEVRWNIEKTRLQFDNSAGDSFVFTKPTLSVLKYQDELSPSESIYFAGITPDEKLLEEMKEVFEKDKGLIYVTDGKGFVQVSSEDFTYQLGSFLKEESGLGYDEKNNTYSTTGLKYAYFDGKNFVEFKNGDDHNAVIQFGASYKATIPEPASALLGILSVTMLIRRRRQLSH